MTNLNVYPPCSESLPSSIIFGADESWFVSLGPDWDLPENFDDELASYETRWTETSGYDADEDPEVDEDDFDDDDDLDEDDDYASDFDDYEEL